MNVQSKYYYIFISISTLFIVIFEVNWFSLSGKLYTRKMQYFEFLVNVVCFSLYLVIINLTGDTFHQALMGEGVRHSHNLEMRHNEIGVKKKAQDIWKEGNWYGDILCPVNKVQVVGGGGVI